MKISFTSDEKLELDIRHHNETNRRVADRIKSVLLRSEGWSVSKIAQALRLHNDTIARYLNDYIKSGSLSFHHKGSSEQLSDDQSAKLSQYLESNLHEKVVEIVFYVKSTYGVSYTVSGMTDWLRRNGFSYKLPKGEPSKADREKQLEFVDEYKKLKAETSNDEPILFIDGVHPTMQSKSACGWIKKGKEKILPTTASRTRLNIMGAIELSKMQTVVDDYKTINGESIIQFLDSIKSVYPNAPTIHIILDQAGYHRSEAVKAHAEKINIKLHYLPPYSPNLNPIERLWKVMNEHVRNNKFFSSAKEFRETIKKFLQVTLPEISASLISQINDNFHVVKTAK